MIYVIYFMHALFQGFWPDGIYTAATDEALVWDIKFAKSLGYNMLRKHIKVEPDRCKAFIAASGFPIVGLLSPKCKCLYLHFDLSVFWHFSFPDADP